MKEKYEVDNNLTQEKTEYEKEKLTKKLKLVRNEFRTVGKYGMPLIKKQEIDIDKIDLWNYTKTKLNDEDNKSKTIHFFTYDWLFENIYEKPELAMEKLSQYYAILSPEFSLYWDMPKALQIYSTFKNRWCGAFFQKHGMKVIPTVCCAGDDSYDFCFDGIEEGSVVAVSTYCREEYKREFMKSYYKMMEVIKPTRIICYGTPFDEMTGNIKAISPFDQEELIAKMGLENYMKKYMSGELYPTGLGYGENAKRHFMEVNNCNELEFAKHLAKAQMDFEERNKIYRWKMVADLEKFGGKNIEIKEIYVPFIKSEYKQDELSLLKNECGFTPRILDVNINNYEGTITVACDKTNKIEWFDDKLNLLDTKYNFGEKFYTSFSVKNLRCLYLTFKLTGEYGDKISKKFSLIECN